MQKNAQTHLQGKYYGRTDFNLVVTDSGFKYPAAEIQPAPNIYIFYKSEV